MAKGIAYIALMVIQIGLMLGNYWFTFGLWPVSWGAFTFFSVATLLVAFAHLALKEDK